MEARSALAIEVEDLDPAGVLARIADAERRDREVQVEKLRLAYQWCVQHPATSATGAATWARTTIRMVWRTRLRGGQFRCLR